MSFIISWSENFGLVDVIDLESLQDLGLSKVADANFGHHWDRHSFLNLLDHLNTIINQNFCM